MYEWVYGFKSHSRTAITTALILTLSFQLKHLLFKYFVQKNFNLRHSKTLHNLFVSMVVYTATMVRDIPDQPKAGIAWAPILKFERYRCIFLPRKRKKKYLFLCIIAFRIQNRSYMAVWFIELFTCFAKTRLPNGTRYLFIVIRGLVTSQVTLL